MSPASSCVRYGLVTGLCFVAHNMVMITADRLCQPLLVAIGASFCSVVVLGYLLHSRVTFAAQGSWEGFMRYAVAMTTNLPLSAASIWVFATALAWPMALAAPSASCCMVVVNFLMSRWAFLGHSRRAEAM